jgi:4-amino-4-deoxy-L-arabinose transferase-like glycosyltransferase
MRRLSFTPALIGVLALALAVRAVYAIAFAPGLSLLDDDTVYRTTAALLADGKGYIQPLTYVFHMRTVPTAEHPPLYPLALAAVIKLVSNDLDVLRIVNVVFGTGTVLVVALIGRRLAGDRTALLAALVCALYPSFVAADGAIMSETLLGLLIGLAMLQTLRLRDAPTPAGMLILGGLVGLGALTRGEALFLWPLLVVPLLWRLPGRRVLLGGLALLGLVVVLAPWVGRNWHTFGQPVLADDDGTALAGSNCHRVYYGHDIGLHSFDCLLDVARGKPPAEDEAANASRQRNAAVDYAKAHPSRAALVTAVRVVRVWGFYQPGRQVHVTGRRPGLQKLGLVVYYLLLVPAAFGVWRLARWREPVWVLLMPFVLTTLTAAATYGLVRLRQESEVSLIVLAAIGVAGRWGVRVP